MKWQPTPQWVRADQFVHTPRDAKGYRPDYASSDAKHSVQVCSCRSPIDGQPCATVSKLKLHQDHSCSALRELRLRAKSRTGPAALFIPYGPTAFDAARVCLLSLLCHVQGLRSRALLQRSFCRES